MRRTLALLALFMAAQVTVAAPIQHFSLQRDEVPNMRPMLPTPPIKLLPAEQSGIESGSRPTDQPCGHDFSTLIAILKDVSAGLLGLVAGYLIGREHADDDDDDDDDVDSEEEIQAASDEGAETDRRYLESLMELIEEKQEAAMLESGLRPAKLL